MSLERMFKLKGEGQWHDYDREKPPVTLPRERIAYLFANGVVMVGFNGAEITSSFFVTPDLRIVRGIAYMYETAVAWQKLIEIA